MTMMEEQTEKKRKLLLNSAITVFALNGYYKSRISDIVKEANVAYGLFYHYFPSKDDILVKIFQTSWLNLVNKIDEVNKSVKDPLERIYKVVEYMYMNYHRNPDLMKVLIMDVPRLERFYDEDNQQIYKKFFSKLETIIIEGQNSGKISNACDPAICSFMVHGVVDAVIRQYVYNPNFNVSAMPIKKVVDQTMKVLTKGFIS